jgi:hypothetical protein
VLSPKELEQRFASAGWELDGSFEDHLLIGFSGDGLSILAHEGSWGTDDPLFEIVDHEGMTNCWVREVPTPEQAQELLLEHARLAQE